MGNLLDKYFFNQGVVFLFVLSFSFQAFPSGQEISSPATQITPFSYIGRDLRQVVPEDDILRARYNQPFVKKFFNSYNVIRFLMSQEIVQAHFTSKIQQGNQQPSPELQVKTLHFITNLIQNLREGSPEQIKNFMLDHDFTKPDKIMALLYLIFSNRFGETMLDLIDSLGLSVNDTLKIKDINGLAVNEKWINPEDVIVVLSHHLVNIGDLPLLNRLMNTDYDASIKNLMNENILHAFLRLNTYRKIAELPPITNYQEFLETLVEYSQALINEKDILGLTPLGIAIGFNDQVAIETFLNGKADLRTRDIFGRSLVELAAVENNVQLVNYLKEKTLEKSEPLTPSTPKIQKQTPGDLTIFQFQTLIDALTNSIISENPHLHSLPSEKIYPSLQKLESYETSRLSALSGIFYSDNSQVSEEAVQIFSAISKRDSRFFKTISENQEQRLGTFFQIGGEDGEISYITNFLLEAIRASSLEAVKFIAKKYKHFPFVQNRMAFQSLDPLSLSLITYASFEEDHPLKSEAKEIVSFVANHIYSKEDSPLFIQFFPPITWAILLGLLEEAQFLHEEKGMNLTSAFMANDASWQATSVHYTQKQGFLKLSEYLQDKLFFSGCHRAQHYH